jgi:hypothetical protein
VVAVVHRKEIHKLTELRFQEALVVEVRIQVLVVVLVYQVKETLVETQQRGNQGGQVLAVEVQEQQVKQAHLLWAVLVVQGYLLQLLVQQ